MLLRQLSVWILCAVGLGFCWPRSTLQAADAPDAGRWSAVLNDALEDILLEALPRSYEEAPGWGNKTRVSAGARLDTQGGRLRIEKRHKEVNDGLWKHYKIWLDRPGKHLNVKITDLRRTSTSTFAFRARLRARLSGTARHNRWERGVQLYNISAEATGDIEIRLQCEVSIGAATEGYFLALAIEPKVKDIDVQLHNFDLNRVSKLPGSAPHELGDGLKDMIERKLGKREPKLVDKLNGSISKRRERLVLSAEDLLEAFGHAIK